MNVRTIFTWLFFVLPFGLMTLPLDKALAATEFHSRIQPVVSLLTVHITLPGASFKAGSPVEGRVIVDSRTSQVLPAVFDITLFHGKDVFATASTSLRALGFGRSVFTFKDFGIPAFNRGEEALGVWRILIVQQGLDREQGAEVSFKIVP